MATQEKIAAVAELKELFEASNAVILTEYRGLTVAQLKELRRALGAETEYAVVKNTLAAIAAKESGIDAFEGQLQGPSALAFIKGDMIDAAKGLRDFAKANPQLIVKSGYYEGAALSEDDVKRYADLESREVLLSKVAGGAKGAIAKVARAVDALRIKLEEQEGAPAAAEETEEA
ncbi:MAG: 50S ribosomal protein L10 [Rothia sp. (in: high G+C Gram-positive bacteria)]|uniref:50S ribosomal protein L10 n=1 Tax=Rothia sp. (in: high G+C Gram-positive bacteria) TaxID=1885016 RepID=UPI0026DF9D72|nr:50S ribosomal protein L10 [Rothia sp. (in: high G+C Gram-positive bacteria)]MDO5749917.1 50S ribosomal protein L10 [Rothia sp. (in: high G+C Gram-positive bacteria)]